MTGRHHRIELRHVPGCANVERTRTLLWGVLNALGLEIEIQELEGPYPSPSVLVDGVDVMGDAGFVGAGCRLDLPDRQRLEACLRPLVQVSEPPAGTG